MTQNKATAKHGKVSSALVWCLCPSWATLLAFQVRFDLSYQWSKSVVVTRRLKMLRGAKSGGFWGISSTSWYLPTTLSPEIRNRFAPPSSWLQTFLRLPALGYIYFSGIQRIINHYFWQQGIVKIIWLTYFTSCNIFPLKVYSWLFLVLFGLCSHPSSSTDSLPC